LSRGNFHWQHEPCWYAVRKGQSSRWRGGRRQTTIWSSPSLNPVGGGTRDGENTATGHSTQKPVWLFEVPIKNHTVAGDVVYDPFIGSGTAIIALELDPRYAQVAVTRWEQFTGPRASRRRSARRRRRS
jgi:DNA modification methylase